MCWSVPTLCTSRRREWNAVDTTSAGDAFAGGYLAARMASQPPAGAARVAADVAATVVSHPGAIVPPRQFNSSRHDDLTGLDAGRQSGRPEPATGAVASWRRFERQSPWCGHID
jgi:hypothetical protein